jgi:hypothetical protein
LDVFGATALAETAASTSPRRMWRGFTASL